VPRVGIGLAQVCQNRPKFTQKPVPNFTEVEKELGTRLAITSGEC